MDVHRPFGCPRRFTSQERRSKIRNEGDAVILEPLKRSEWADGFWDIFAPDPDFEIPEPLATKPLDLD